MSWLIPVIPQHEGLLPKWLLLISIIAFGNSIQAYMTLKFTRRVYSGTTTSSSSSQSRDATAYEDRNPVTPLSSRTFGTWSFLSSVVRLYAAYHIDNPVVYELALWTFVIAGWHFFTEWFWYRTTNWGAGLAGPVIVPTVSTIWMLACWDGYVGR